MSAAIPMKQPIGAIASATSQSLHRLSGIESVGGRGDSGWRRLECDVTQVQYILFPVVRKSWSVDYCGERDAPQVGYIVMRGGDGTREQLFEHVSGVAVLTGESVNLRFGYRPGL